MMLAAFPTPYPDELLYSLCARYTARMRYSSASIAAEELFGTRNVVAVVDLPSRLDTLSSRLPKALGFDPEALIKNHTMLPLYAPFLSTDRLQRVRRSMLGKGGGAIHNRIGIMASRIPTLRKLRFCPICVNEDRSEYGECYWHRVHHIPGIGICAHHECDLQDSAVSFSRGSIHYFHSAAEDVIPELGLARPAVANPHLQDIANQAYWLLNNGFDVDSDAIYATYCVSLEFRELKTTCGSTRQQQLHSSFLDFYSPELLDSLFCSFEDANETWLRRILRGDNEAHHPVRHLLVLRFFGHTPQTAAQNPYARVVPEPFGCGPWPCLNSVCPQSYQDTITTYSVKRSRYANNRPIATFACPICGFIYTRTGPDNESSSRYRVGKILAFGSVWEEKLITLLQEQILSLRGISRVLNVDINTVKRYAQRLLPDTNGVPKDKTQNSNKNPSQGASIDGLVMSYRQAWIDALELFPHLGASKLRKLYSKIYTWLYRHDKDWLILHTPSPPRRTIRLQRVSWPTRDESLVKSVLEAATRLMSRPEAPKQMTLYAIGREADCLPLLRKHLDKLPQTAEALKDLVESREAWAVRRLQWTIDQARDQGVLLKGWEIVRRSGLARFPKKWFKLHGVEF